ncbi:MAG: PHP domain-containing protein [Pseudomonadota bacterium]
MIIDLHCHSIYSRDNHLDPQDLIDRAVELGLDGVCFTEHYSVQASLPVTRLMFPHGFLVLRGVEISTDCGHLLAYGLKDDSWNKWGTNSHLVLGKVIETVHCLGGVCVPAHPFRGWESMGERVFNVVGLDAVETYNGGNDYDRNLLAVSAAEELSIPSIGGSDCHRVDQVGRAYTYFRNNVSDMDGLVGEIKAGRCLGMMREW